MPAVYPNLQSTIKVIIICTQHIEVSEEVHSFVKEIPSNRPRTKFLTSNLPLKLGPHLHLPFLHQPLICLLQINKLNNNNNNKMRASQINERKIKKKKSFTIFFPLMNDNKGPKFSFSFFLNAMKNNFNLLESSWLYLKDNLTFLCN